MRDMPLSCVSHFVFNVIEPDDKNLIDQRIDYHTKVRSLLLALSLTGTCVWMQKLSHISNSIFGIIMMPLRYWRGHICIFHGYLTGIKIRLVKSNLLCVHPASTFHGFVEQIVFRTTGSQWGMSPVVSFIKEVNSRLIKRPLVFHGCLASRGLTSLVKGATGDCWGSEKTPPQVARNGGVWGVFSDFIVSTKF